MTHVGTIDQIIAERKKVYPDDGLTKNALRKLVVTGQISSVMVGQKYLIAFDAVESFLSNPPTIAQEAGQNGKIRRIS